MKKVLSILLVFAMHTIVPNSFMPNSLKWQGEQAARSIKNRVEKRYGRGGSRSSSRTLKSPDSLAATLTAFGGEDRFFLAGSPAETGTKTLSRAKFATTVLDGTKFVQIMPIATDAQIKLNGVLVDESPLKGIKVDALTLGGDEQKAIVSDMRPQPEVTDQTTKFPSVFLVKNDDGEELLTNEHDFDDDTGFLYDAQNPSQKVVGPVVALAATGNTDGNFIIAAVPEATKKWDGLGSGDPMPPATDGRGLALLKINDNASEQNLQEIKVLMCSGALPVSGIAGSDVLPYQDRIELGEKGVFSFFAPKDLDPLQRGSLGNAVDMYWDKTLQRLYIGLSDVTRGDSDGSPNQQTTSVAKNYSGGVTSVLVGKFATVPDELALRGGNIGEGEGEGEGGGNDGCPFETVDFTIEPVIKNISSYILPNLLTDDDGETLGDEKKFSDNFAHKYILGFYRTNEENGLSDRLFATARKVRTMHTSTGKSYLIVNGGVASSRDGVTPPEELNVQMYAMPLIDNGPEDDATGFVARNDDTTKVIDLQPIVDEALMHQGGDEELGSEELYQVYNKDGDTTTYVGPFPDYISDVTDQASFRRFIKNAMPLSSNEAQRIGGIEDPEVFNQLLSFDGSANIRDVQVFGDTVYIAVASQRDFDHFGEAGIFSSTALFYPTGEIRAWTPWQRVMGNHDAAYGMGFDGESNNFWYFTTDGGVATDTSAPTVVNVTQWGLGDKSRHGDDASLLLSSVIEKAFPPATGGVLGLFSFGPDTPGFKPRIPGHLDDIEKRHEQFSMMVATGNQRVAIIETGSRIRSQDGVFEPTAAFKKFVPGSGDDNAANVYVFAHNSDGDIGFALGRIGNITSAEVARFEVIDGNDSKGWLFVGGEHGVAVLVQDWDGHGWPNADEEGLERLLPGTGLAGFGSGLENFPGGSAWFFLQLMVKTPNGGSFNPFEDVRKLVSDGDKYLYILTGRALFRVEMTDVNFSGDANIDEKNSRLQARIAPENVVVIATMPDSKLIDTSLKKSIGDRTDQLFDMMVIKRDKTEGEEKSSLLLATSKGVFLSDEITDVPQEPGKVQWKQVKTANDNTVGPAFLLDFSSTERAQKMVLFGDEEGSQFLSAEGNVGVTAFDNQLEYLARYRFNVENGDVTAFKEPYGTDYFFKYGSLVNPGNTHSNQLPARDAFYSRIAAFPASDRSFANRVPVLPSPDKYLKKTGPDTELYDPIDLGFDVELPLQLGKMVLDHASGAVYVPGQFGVRVNE